MKMLKFILVTIVLLAVFVNAKKDENENTSFTIHAGELAATSDTDEMVKKVEEQVRATLKNPGLKKFKAVSYRTDFPIFRGKKMKGTSYFVKVNTGNPKAFIILRIFQDVPKKTTVLLGIKTKQHNDDPIEYFDGNVNSFKSK